MIRGGLSSPVGNLTVTVDDGAVTVVEWRTHLDVPDDPTMHRAIAQLQAYFAGDLQKFDLPIRPRASVFQAAFYAALCEIPYGETKTYGDLAKELDVSAQAIGQACGGNPIPIVIPCHRVLAVTGLGGFSGGGGIEAKVGLLRLEWAASLLI